MSSKAFARSEVCSRSSETKEVLKYKMITMYCSPKCERALRSQLEWVLSLNTWGNAPHSQLPNPHVSDICNVTPSNPYNSVPLHNASIDLPRHKLDPNHIHNQPRTRFHAGSHHYVTRHPLASCNVPASSSIHL